MSIRTTSSRGDTYRPVCQSLSLSSMRCNTAIMLALGTNGKPSVYVVKADEINLYSNTESIRKVILSCPYKGFEITRDEDYGRDIIL